MPPLTVRNFFSRNGPLAGAHPNYEFRDGQLTMALAVEKALADRRHTIVEAGTGTGKTLAYLVPALLSGKRVVISTGTKNLQEQLFYKDIPFLEQFFPAGIRACLMKGRSNYLCRQKLYDAEREPILEGLDEVSDFAIIRQWEKETDTGDRASLKELNEASTAWQKLDARRETCTGQKCPQFDRCFLTEMHKRAMESDIIVVNHHLFFADLAVKEEDFGGIIPDYSAVIFDEAHEIEDVAGQYFGLSVSNYQVEDLRRDIQATAHRKEALSKDLDQMLSLLADQSDRFFNLLPQQDGRNGYEAQSAFLDMHGDTYHRLFAIVEMLAAHISTMQKAPEEFVPLHSRLLELRDKLRRWMEPTDASCVYFIERRGRGIFLQATPIDVSALLRERFFSSVPVAVLTSATLAVGEKFDYLRSRLGIDDARELIVPSHYDYQNQCLLYVPHHMPDVRSQAYPEAAAKEIVAVLEHSRGRAFVLFTSYQQMRATHERVADALDFPVLLQGTAPQRLLLEEFRTTPHCVLFATSSFWQGVDVQGDQLSCVIIDKLPFAVPSDPVVGARINALRASGGNPFVDYQVPQAAIALKQGFGRLIRSRNDRGVLVLLDNRITRQRYGQIFFDSLPPYGFTTRVEDVEEFFQRCLN